MSLAALALVALEEFTAGGVTYQPGDFIPQAAPGTWPEGSLETRIERGFVKYTPAAADTPPEDVNTTPTLEELFMVLEGMTKTELRDFGVEQYGVELDPNKLSKPDMLLGIKELVAEHGAPPAPQSPAP